MYVGSDTYDNVRTKNRKKIRSGTKMFIIPNNSADRILRFLVPKLPHEKCRKLEIIESLYGKLMNHST